jgi:hypothetical protein
MTIPLLHLPLDASLAGRDRNGVLTAVGSGALRYQDGYWAGVKAALIQEATTNEFYNPDFSSSSGGFVMSGNQADVLFPTTGGQDNGPCMEISGSISGGGARINSTHSPVPMVNPGLVRTFSFDAKHISGGNLWHVSVLEIDSTNTVLKTAQGILNFTTTAEWVRHAVSYTPTEAGTSWVSFSIRRAENVAGVARFDRIQVEQKPYATSFAMGSLGAGYAWTGTANASASTRTGTALTLSTTDRLRLDRGSLVMWIKPDYKNPASLRYPELFTTMHSTGVTAGFSAFITDRDGSDEVWMYAVNVAGSNVSARSMGLTPVVPADGEWTLIYFDWTESAIGFSYGNSGRVEAARTNYVADEPLGPTLRLGGTGVNSWDGHIGPVLTFDRPLTASERTKLFNALRPWAWETLFPQLGGILRIGGSEPLGILRIGGSDTP